MRSLLGVTGAARNKTTKGLAGNAERVSERAVVAYPLIPGNIFCRAACRGWRTETRRAFRGEDDAEWGRRLKATPRARDWPRGPTVPPTAAKHLSPSACETSRGNITRSKRPGKAVPAPPKWTLLARIYPTTHHPETGGAVHTGA